MRKKLRINNKLKQRKMIMLMIEKDDNINDKYGEGN